MKIVMGGSSEPFIENVKNLCKFGYRPELLVLHRHNYLEISKRALGRLGIETIVTDDIHSLAGRIKKIEPDLMIFIAYPEIIKLSILGIPKIGAVNLHTSILPKYRGRHPVNWAIINGEREMGITVHFMNENIDDGDIVLQDSIEFARDDDYGTISKRLIACGKKLLLTAVRQIENKCAYRRKQIRGFSTYLAKRTPADSRIDWMKTSFQLNRFINALVDPMPNAFGFKNRERIQFRRAYPGKRAGEVLGVTRDGRYVISTNDGVILVNADTRLKKGDILS